MEATFQGHTGVKVVAAADPRREARDRFAAAFGGRAYATLDELLSDPEIVAVYISTPHEMHAEHAIAAARAGKHVLVEKPMAISVAESRAMVNAAREAGTILMVGHSHSYDAPIGRAKALIASGRYGPLRMVTALNFTDFVYRPRRPEEFATEKGGGVVWSQGAHQVDVVRLLVGAPVVRVSAHVGVYDPARPMDGAYSALLTFANNVTATLTYSGYGHFDSDELMGWIGESGTKKDPEAYGPARRALSRAKTQDEETALKHAQRVQTPQTKRLHEHFGFVVASCEGADLRPLPAGVMVYANAERHLDPLDPPSPPRASVLDELVAAVQNGIAPLHSGEWGVATLEVCEAILRASVERCEVRLQS